MMLYLIFFIVQLPINFFIKVPSKLFHLIRIIGILLKIDVLIQMLLTSLEMIKIYL